MTKTGNIEIPGYKTIVPNEVFERKSGLLTHGVLGKGKKGSIESTRLIKLKRFKVPTRDEVINFVRTKARGIDISSFDMEPSPNEQDINIMLRMFPLEYFKHVADGKGFGFDHLCHHYSKLVFNEGRSYIESVSGVVPTWIMGMINSMAALQGTITYERAIKNGGKDTFDLAIRLLDNGRLPNQSEIDFLFAHRVRESDILCIRGDLKDYQKVAEHAKTLYGILNSSEMIGKLYDSSSNYLEKTAENVVEDTCGCMTKIGAIRELPRVLGKMLEKLEQGELKDRSSDFPDMPGMQKKKGSDPYTN